MYIYGKIWYPSILKSHNLGLKAADKIETKNNTMRSVVSNRSVVVFVAVLFLNLSLGYAWSPNAPFSRRDAMTAATSAATVVVVTGKIPLAWAQEEEGVVVDVFHNRNRNMNKNALIREDYWYMLGKTPPRKMLDGMMKTDDPRFNAFGACQTTKGGTTTTNSCTYVPLKQRIPAYSKYAWSIDYGAKDYRLLGEALSNQDWTTAQRLLADTSPPPPSVDALLKMVLFASQMLTTPNYTGPSRELLVARFYANEANYATQQLRKAVHDRDAALAQEAWEFGRDSWNSYLNIVNRQIVEKVGDKIKLI